jgi:primosomal protein N' (replication factor Y)
VLVEVAVPLPVHGSFTYLAPDDVAVGWQVLVPFGAREVHGWVVGPGGARPDVKPIVKVAVAAPAFDEQQLAFFRWMSGYYLAPLGEVLATAIPSMTGARTRHVYEPTPEGVERLATRPPADEPGMVLREVVARPGIGRAALSRRLHGEVADVAPALSALVAAGLIHGVDVEIKAAKPRRREAEGRVAAPTTPPALNADQAQAVAAVKGPGTWLLHGVTGSGKTEVYLALAARALQAGAQALLLVPEIALTPQFVGRFEARFPSRVALLHSGLTPAERRDMWVAVREGRANVAIGARSALFAPFSRLGLVVVDEEHDDAYKQDDGVRYHARDCAVMRAHMAGCPCVLGSATPSLESWLNAERGRYVRLSMPRRATPRPVPQVAVIDMRAETRDERGRAPVLAASVEGALREALEAGGKAILLYNRRGYATFVECPSCGACWECPSCGIALVYHQAAQRLDCHYCGFHRGFTPACTKCGDPVEVMGRGTERVEEQVAALFPGVPVGRMDADTTAKRGDHARILDAFARGDTRLLVGTQLVAKGHDFPDVHVAAVVGCDHVLGMPDFRAAERTFGLVTQLCGRAGRGEVPGRVFLQTHHPEHPVFATIGDMAAFAGHELPLRRMLAYPPLTRLVLLSVEGRVRQDARDAAANLAKEARRASGRHAGVDVLGPCAAPLPRLVGRWRFQVVLRGREPRSFRAFLQDNHEGWSVPRGVRMHVDVDPRHLA